MPLRIVEESAEERRMHFICSYLLEAQELTPNALAPPQVLVVPVYRPSHFVNFLLQVSARPQVRN